MEEQVHVHVHVRTMYMYIYYMYIHISHTVWFSRMNWIVFSLTSFRTLPNPTDRSFSSCSVLVTITLLFVQHLRLVTLRERGKGRKRGREEERKGGREGEREREREREREGGGMGEKEGKRD